MSKTILNERISLALSPVDKEETYDAVLDEMYGEIDLGVTFSPSYALRKLDPICYEIGMNDHFDNEDDFYELDGEYYWKNEVDEIKKEIENE